MKWHIITGSKGGVGKTLLSLLLLADCLEEEKRKAGSTLILDMNGMNTDSSAIVLYKTIAKPKSTTIDLETNITLYHQDADSINFQTAYADDSQGQAQEYIVGFPANPFVLMNPQLFADFLKTITANAEKIENELNLSSPLRYVIIDTNYHFCNLFAQDDEFYINNYKQGILQGEVINIWFLWVYRQFEKLVTYNNTETDTIRQTAHFIEKYLKGSYCQQGDISTPLIHVFTPSSLMISPEQGNWNKVILQSLGLKKNQEYYVVPEFEILENFEIGECIDFNNWVTHLNQAYNAILEKLNEESVILFPKALVEAVKRSSSGDEQRPQNIIPLSVHEDSLEHYTDKERPNAVARLRRLEIYKHLIKLL